MWGLILIRGICVVRRRRILDSAMHRIEWYSRMRASLFLDNLESPVTNVCPHAGFDLHMGKLSLPSYIIRASRRLEHSQEIFEGWVADADRFGGVAYHSLDDFAVGNCVSAHLERVDDAHEL
jgi:hypothetical protein